MRYTEARLAPITSEMLADIEKNTVDFTPNFDGSLSEPMVLPAKSTTRTPWIPGLWSRGVQSWSRDGEPAVNTKFVTQSPVTLTRLAQPLGKGNETCVTAHVAPTGDCATTYSISRCVASTSGFISRPTSPTQLVPVRLQICESKAGGSGKSQLFENSKVSTSGTPL